MNEWANLELWSEEVKSGGNKSNQWKGETMGSDIQAGDDFGIIIQQPQSCTVIRERDTVDLLYKN